MQLISQHVSSILGDNKAKKWSHIEQVSTSGIARNYKVRNCAGENRSSQANHGKHHLISQHLLTVQCDQRVKTKRLRIRSTSVTW